MANTTSVPSRRQRDLKSKSASLTDRLAVSRSLPLATETRDTRLATQLLNARETTTIQASSLQSVYTTQVKISGSHRARMLVSDGQRASEWVVS